MHLRESTLDKLINSETDQATPENTFNLKEALKKFGIDVVASVPAAVAGGTLFWANSALADQEEAIQFAIAVYVALVSLSVTNNVLNNYLHQKVNNFHFNLLLLPGLSSIFANLGMAVIRDIVPPVQSFKMNEKAFCYFTSILYFIGVGEKITEKYSKENNKQLNTFNANLILTTLGVLIAGTIDYSLTGEVKNLQALAWQGVSFAFANEILGASKSLFKAGRENLKTWWNNRLYSQLDNGPM